MDIKNILAILISISTPLSGSITLMSPSILETALHATHHKIVYVGVGAASATDTYQAFPLFMQQLFEHYPDLCKIVNFDQAWSEKSFAAAQLLQRSPSVNVQNFFIIAENLDLEISAYKLYPYLDGVLKRGGIVILGKFTNYNSALELSLLYMWLLNVQSKNQILLFSTLAGAHSMTLYWWNGMPYSLYDDMIMTERLVAFRSQNRVQPLKKTLAVKKNVILDKLKLLISQDRDKILDANDQKIVLIPEQESELINDFEHKKIEIPRTSLENTSSFVIDVVKSPNGIFSIEDVYFLKETLENLHRSLQLIALVANTR